MTTDQIVINFALAGVSGVLGFLMRAVWTAVKDLQAADAELAEKLSRVEVVVAGEYVRKEDFDRKLDALFTKLDRIEEKLDRKADKH